MALIQEDYSPLKVPFGLSAQGQLVPACLARKSLIHHCPECGGELLLREGPRRRAHFAHKVEASCNGETWLHRVAKRWLAQAFVPVGRRRRIPSVTLACPGIQIPGCTEYSQPCGRLVIQDLRPLNIDEARLEMSLSNGYRPDVVLLRAGIPVLSLEVRVSHAVDEAKALALELPWLEVDALALLERPMRLNPLAKNLPWNPQCPECAAADTGAFSDITDRAHFKRVIQHHRMVMALRRSLSGASLPFLSWHCPRCRRRNKRRLPIEGVSSVNIGNGGSIQVTSHCLQTLNIHIHEPPDPYRPSFIQPLPTAGEARIIVTPGLKESPIPLLIGTNMSGHFLCPRCKYDARSG